MPHVDQRWYRLAHYDSAIVSTADGVAASWYRRDTRPSSVTSSRAPPRCTSGSTRSGPSWRARYREALPELTSPETWKLTFEGLDDASSTLGSDGPGGGHHPLVTHIPVDHTVDPDLVPTPAVPAPRR